MKYVIVRKNGQIASKDIYFGDDDKITAALDVKTALHAGFTYEICTQATFDSTTIQSLATANEW